MHLIYAFKLYVCKYAKFMQSMYKTKRMFINERMKFKNRLNLKRDRIV